MEEFFGNLPCKVRGCFRSHCSLLNNFCSFEPEVLTVVWISCNSYERLKAINLSMLYHNLFLQTILFDLLGAYFSDSGVLPTFNLSATEILVDKLGNRMVQSALLFSFGLGLLVFWWPYGLRCSGWVELIIVKDFFVIFLNHKFQNNYFISLFFFKYMT